MIFTLANSSCISFCVPPSPWSCLHELAVGVGREKKDLNTGECLELLVGDGTTGIRRKTSKEKKTASESEMSKKRELK